MEEEPLTEEGEGRATGDDIEEMEQLWEAPVVSVNAAETDIASSIDGNMELTSPTEAMTTRPAITKIKLNISKPIISNANNANSNSDAVNNNNNEDDAERKKRGEMRWVLSLLFVGSHFINMYCCTCSGFEGVSCV